MKIEGVIPPISTPFENGGPALDKLVQNIEKWNETALSGYLVLGSNGESVYLAEQEKLAVVNKAREAIPASKCMIVGTGLESTRETIRLTNLMADGGADYGLVAPPFYFKNSMHEGVLADHFTAVAEASRMPVLLYNVPQFTGVNLDPSLVARLSLHPNIVGIKDSSGNIAQLNEILFSSQEGFTVLVGSAPVFFPALCIGASGGILAVANVVPKLCIEIFDLYQKGLFQEAKKLQNQMTPLAKAVTVRYGISGLKAAMDAVGYFGGKPRLPLQSLDSEGKAEIKILLRDLERAHG
ncbi:MAG: dihydrodipicolinate synthase family protein [Desulfovermiculus sp.]